MHGLNGDVTDCESRGAVCDLGHLPAHATIPIASDLLVRPYADRQGKLG